MSEMSIPEAVTHLGQWADAILAYNRAIDSGYFRAIERATTVLRSFYAEGETWV